MMWRILLGLWILAISPSHADAEPDTLGVVFGKVVSVEDGLPISDAAVIVLGKAMGTSTDRAGQFRILGVPLGVQTLGISLIGFKRVERKVTVLPGENPTGTIEFEFQAVKAWYDGGLVRPYRGSVGSRARETNLQCVVRLIEPRLAVGDPLEIEARIYNLDKHEVILPVGRDGCDEFEFPRIVVRVDGPTDGFVLKPEDHLRGQKPLRVKDFVTVGPRDGFDPLLRGWKPTRLRLGQIKKPGKYQLVFQYSTYEVNPDRWLGDTRFTRHAATLVNRLEQVPLVQLADSVSFVVRE